MKKNIAFTVILIICLISLILGALTPINNKMKTIDNEKKAESKINKFLPMGNKIAVITVSGVISSNPSINAFETNPSLNALKALAMAEKDKNVKGVLLKINSPGGTVGMSQRLYNQILKIRKEKPVVAIMEDVAASGGYYIASACDRIVALPGTMTGSIGVIMSTMDMHKLFSEKLGINQNVIKSGKYKDIGSSSRAMTSDERTLLQDIINDSYSQFKEAIIQGRVNRDDKYKAIKVNLTLNSINNYADGRIFTGSQALKYGFIDSVEGMDKAKEMLISMAQEKFPNDKITEDINYSEYALETTLIELFGINTNNSRIENIIPNSMKYARTPLYLWE